MIGGNLSPEQQRRVLDSALNLMSSCAPSEITLDRLAADAGLSGFDIVRHYHSRENILAAVLERELEMIVTALPSPELRFPDETLKDELQTLAKVMLQEYRPRIAFMQKLLAEALHNREVARIFYRTFIVQGRLMFTEFLNVRKRRGEVREDLDVEAAAAGFLGAITGMLLMIEHFGGREVEPIDEDRLAREIPDVFLRGVSKR